MQTKIVCDDNGTDHTESENVVELGNIISTNVQIESANSLTVKCEANLEPTVNDNIYDGEMDIEGEMCDGNATIACDGQASGDCIGEGESAHSEVTLDPTVEQNTDVREHSEVRVDPTGNKDILADNCKNSLDISLNFKEYWD